MKRVKKGKGNNEAESKKASMNSLSFHSFKKILCLSNNNLKFRTGDIYQKRSVGVK